MTELFPHQKAGILAAVNGLRRGGGYYLNWWPGMGKTLGAIAIARMLHCRNILVVAPVVALGVWRREVEKWWPGTPVDIIRDDAWSALDSYTARLSSSPAFLVTNYDQLLGRVSKQERDRVLELCEGDEKKAKRKVNAVKRKRQVDRLSPLVLWNLDMVVLDESHLAKSNSAERTHAVQLLARAAKYRLLLSGTPAHNPLDWWTQWNLVAPNDPVWSMSYSSYKNWIAVLGGLSGNWVVGFRPEAKEEALRSIRPYTHIATSDELDLPEPIVSPVYVPLTSEEDRAYQQMKRSLVVELGGEEVMTAQIIITKGLRLQQITSGHLEKKKVVSSKLAACLDLLEERSHQKVIVACKFNWEREELEKALKKIERPVMSIYGGVPQEARDRFEQLFQKTNAPYVLILQYRAGGMSITLTEARCMILYSLEHSYIAHQQMVGRVYRIGQTCHVQVIPILSEGTVDERIYEALTRKSEDEDLATLILKEIRE